LLAQVKQNPPLRATSARHIGTGRRSQPDNARPSKGVADPVPSANKSRFIPRQKLSLNFAVIIDISARSSLVRASHPVSDRLSEHAFSMKLLLRSLPSLACSPRFVLEPLGLAVWRAVSLPVSWLGHAT